MKKCLLVVLLCFVFLFIAIGSGDDDSTHDSVKIDSDGNTDTSGKKNDNSQSEVKYEITNTGFNYYTNSIGGLQYFGYVEIKNTGNCDIYLEDCKFDLEDNSGHLLQTDSLVSSCPAVISPGEKGYFFNMLGSSTIDSGVSLDNGVKLVPQMKLTKAKGKPNTYPVSDISVRAGDYGDIKVTGRIDNTSGKDIDYLYVDVFFYNSEGKLIAITGTSITNIGAGMKGSFEAAMYPNNYKFEDITETKIIAEESYLQF